MENKNAKPKQDLTPFDKEVLDAITKLSSYKTTITPSEIREDLQKYKLYTVKELEPVIGKSRQSIILYIKAGKLKAKKIGNQWRISEEALREFLGLD